MPQNIVNLGGRLERHASPVELLAADGDENAIALEAVAAMASRTLELDPDARPMADYLLERHYRRKHGAGAYYGQDR